MYKTKESEELIIEIKRRIIKKAKRVKGEKSKGGRIKSIPTVVEGIQFDSRTEARYYRYLRSKRDVVNIECHPSYTLIPAFTIASSLTQSGKSTKEAMKFTPDFKVTYADGRIEVIDVKGSKKAINDGFTVRRKLWEFQNQQELIVVIWDKEKRKWIRS